MWNCDIHSISTNYVNRVQPRYNFHNRAMNRGIYPEITVDDREIKKDKNLHLAQNDRYKWQNKAQIYKITE